MLEGVLFRSLNEELLGNKDHPLSGINDKYIFEPSLE